MEQHSAGGGFFSSGCESCGCLSFSQEYHKAFGIIVCSHCSRDVKLIAKGNAKTRYLLTDGDLKGLGFITRENPQKKNWSAMKLYMQDQVEDIARQKHGDADAIRQQKLSRVESKVNKRKLEAENSSQQGTNNSRQQQVRAKLLQEYEGAMHALAEDKRTPTVAVGEGVEQEQI